MSMTASDKMVAIYKELERSGISNSAKAVPDFLQQRFDTFEFSHQQEDVSSTPGLTSR